MRKVVLSMKESEKITIIKRVDAGEIPKKTAAIKLGVSLRQINRLLQKYKNEGKTAFRHGNAGRKPVHALSEQQKKQIVALYNQHYWDTNFTHCCELLFLHNSIQISPSTLKKILDQEHILSPKATRSSRNKMAKYLRQLQDQTISIKEKNALQTNIVAIEDAHPRRSRSPNFGELIQMDASDHPWFGQHRSHLHIAIDDATGVILAAYFDKQETLHGYYQVFYQILTRYGIPTLFYTDNRTIFEYKNKRMKDVKQDTFTQFSYACKQLGVKIKTTSVPQAKGRVERLFQTLQSRLPVELRSEGVTSIDEANVFLKAYIKEYNKKFALPIHDSKSVFIKQIDPEVINQTLAVLTPRIIDTGHCIRFNRSYYKLIDRHGTQIFYRQGTKGLVIQTFRKELLFSTNDNVYCLIEIPLHQKTSQNFDSSPDTPEKIKIPYIPSPKHPWRNENFLKHVPYTISPKDLEV